jgi:hypothetical protein
MRRWWRAVYVSVIQPWRHEDIRILDILNEFSEERPPMMVGRPTAGSHPHT